MNKFKERLKELRASKELDQKDLSAILHISKSTVSGWETGRNQPNYDMLITLARFFDVSVDFIIGNTEI